LQIFPHPWFTYLKNVARAHRLESLQTLLSQRRRLQSWLELAKALFDQVLEEGGVWHLYGHSWDIDNLGLWADLGEILDYVGGREGVSYVSNCALVSSLGMDGSGPVTDKSLYPELTPRSASLT
jgi:hypothetical protein